MPEEPNVSSGILPTAAGDDHRAIAVGEKQTERGHGGFVNAILTHP